MTRRTSCLNSKAQAIFSHYPLHLSKVTRKTARAAKKLIVRQMASQNTTLSSDKTVAKIGLTLHLEKKSQTRSNGFTALNLVAVALAVVCEAEAPKVAKSANKAENH